MFSIRSAIAFRGIYPTAIRIDARSDYFEQTRSPT